ncbi:MAG: A/G-specific adenine glycosylase [Lautropia sp.]|nr:A/G-specific adenine glycosylase [Lautropia sp.]
MAVSGRLVPPPSVAGVAPALIRWQRRHGRHHLPWQRTQAELGLAQAEAKAASVLRDPYRVWLSEVMLQQTQVVTVVPYFERFLSAFPTVGDLAAAEAEQVMGLWAGLGYYSRARNLMAAARQVASQGGVFPSEPEGLAALPGVGRSTAAAIAVFGFGRRAAILDGNVKRVFCRVFAIDGNPTESATLKRLWAHAEAELPPEGASAADLIAYTQGLMDLGAMVCTRTKPACERCPLAELCEARGQDAVGAYPQPKVRKAQPVREVHLLLVQAKGSVMLEARPARGLWGGLWSLPELSAEPPSGWRLAGGFEHVFTHFRMKAKVWMPPVAKPNRCEEPSPLLAEAWPSEPMQRWVKPGALDALPLPKPIRAWLDSAEAVAGLRA